MGERICLQHGRCEFDPLEKGMAPHSSIFAWKIPWTEEPGGLQSMGRTKSKVTEHTACMLPKLEVHRLYSPGARSHLLLVCLFVCLFLTWRRALFIL